MNRKQIFWAIAIGAMLAITGCGDDSGNGGGSGGDGGSGGSAGMGGSAGTGGGAGDFCETLCAACGGGQAECASQCEQGIGEIPGELNDCPNELDALGNCLAANDCSDPNACQSEWTDWAVCLVSPF